MTLLPNLDWGKLLSTTFPGLLVGLSIYMLVDIVSAKDITAQAVSGDPAVVTASLIILAAFSTFLGVFVDAISHVILENLIHETLGRFKTIQTARRHRLIARARDGESFTAIYRSEVDKDVRQQEIDSHYRFTEFSVNGTVALLLFTWVFPAYLYYVLNYTLHAGAAVALLLAVATSVMVGVSVGNMSDWEDVRSDLVFGTLDKN